VYFDQTTVPGSFDRRLLGTGTLSGTFDGRTLSGTIEVGPAEFMVTNTLTLRLTNDGRLEGRVGSILGVELIFSRR
jgi:hypothetical protein